MQGYSLQNGARRIITIPSFSSAIEKSGAQFYVEYGNFKWECEFRKSSSDGVHPSWYYGKSIRVPNTTASMYDNLIDFYAKQYQPRYSYGSHRINQEYWRIEILNRDICVFSIVVETSDCMELKNIFDLKTVKQQNRNLLLTDALDITITIGTSDILGSSSVTVLPAIEDQTTMNSLKEMYDKGILTDVVIRTAEKDFPCHKVALASSSDVFRAMFETEMLESTKSVVDLTLKFDAATVHDLLHYLYTKKESPNVKKTCKDLFVAADFFQVPVLKDICTQTLLSVISIENAAEIAQLAETYNVEVLRNSAVNFIAENFQDVVSTAEWNSIPDHMAKKLLTSFLSIISQKKWHKC